MFLEAAAGSPPAGVGPVKPVCHARVGPSHPATGKVAASPDTGSFLQPVQLFLYLLHEALY